MVLLELAKMLLNFSLLKDLKGFKTFLLINKT